MKAAYADPPYLGCGKTHYGHLHEAAADYDDPATHQRLIERLQDEFDCWALSLHEPSLRTILPMCPAGVRVGSWVKPFAAFKKNVTRAYTWEPVIFKFDGGRARTVQQDTWRDHISAPIAMRKGFPGAKPDAFSFWIFEGLNLQPQDKFCDVFPGSGAVGDAWEKWRARMSMPAPMQMLLTPADDPCRECGGTDLRFMWQCASGHLYRCGRCGNEQQHAQPLEAAPAAAEGA